jgi:hypothetical protein
MPPSGNTPTLGQTQATKIISMVMLLALNGMWLLF